MFVCIASETQQLLNAFNNDVGVRQALERASSKVCVAVCEINREGRIGKPSYIRNERDALPIIEVGEQEIIFQEGVRCLFDAEEA